MTVASAISRADLVIIPCQGSQDDADEAVKTIRLINRQVKVLNRSIPFCVLYVRTSPAITPRTLRHIMGEFSKAGIDVFNTSLVDREAFRSIRSFGGTIDDLDPNQVSGIDKAVVNVRAFAAEVIAKIKTNGA
jgi:chromosome partitioning protein